MRLIPLFAVGPLTSVGPLIALGLAAQAVAFSQKFEVASIKPNAANDQRVMFRMAPGGRLNLTGISARQLIAQAYNVRDFQITGGPGWLESDRWDITAKAEDGGPERMPPETMQAMMRNLLEERFGLKVRQETKEASGYALVAAKGGPKLKAAENGAPGGMFRMGRGMINARGATMANLTQQLAQNVGRPVVDKTGLEGRYDIELRWTPEPGQGPAALPGSPEALASTDAGGPSIFAALQEQLGLRLESTRTSVPMIVIEAVSRPTEN